MQVVNVLDSLDFLQAFGDALEVILIGCGLKDEDNALPEGHARRPENNEGEDIRAGRVHPPELVWCEEDANSSNYNTN